MNDLVRIVRAEDRHSGEIATMFCHLQNIHADIDPFLFKKIENVDAICADIQNKITSGSRLFLLAYVGEELSGYLEASFGISEESEIFISHKVAKIENIFIHESKRRMGCATALFNAFVDFADRLGFSEHIELDVMSENEGAIAFYKKIGFSQYKTVLKKR